MCAITVRLRSADARARRRPRDEAVRVDAAWPKCLALRPGLDVHLEHAPQEQCPGLALRQNGRNVKAERVR